MSLVSNVTAPLCVSSLPFTVAPVVTVIDTADRMFPWKMEAAPRVAELPTSQKMLAALAPRIRLIWLALTS